MALFLLPKECFAKPVYSLSVRTVTSSRNIAKGRGQRLSTIWRNTNPPLSWEDRQLPGSPEGIIKSVCQLMRTNGDKLVLATASEMKARADEVLENVKINEI